jgi:flagellar biosynthesis protein FlhG
MTAEEIARSLQVEPSKLRYLEFLCQGFVSKPRLGFQRQYSMNDLEIMGTANRLLAEGIPPNALKSRLAKKFFLQERKSLHEAPGSSFAPPGAALITVSSGKGGVGKSTLALNLGVELKRAGHRVVVIDGDWGTANLHVMAGLRVERTLRQVASGECGIEEVIMGIPGGPDIVPGSSGIFEMANLSRSRQDTLLSELLRLGSRYEIILVDTAAGVAAPVVEFVAASDLGLIVTSPEKTAITDAYALIKLSVERNRHCKLGLVVNRIRSAREGAFVLGRIAGCARRFLNQSVLELGYVWEDAHVRRAVNEGVSLSVQYPESKASLSIRKLARLLQENNLLFSRSQGLDSGFQMLMRPAAKAAAGWAPS